jgi:transposase-like protein
MAKRIDKATKQQLLADIKNGMKVAEASAKYNVVDGTIYAWLKQQADNTGTSSLDVARLRKENMELKELIGLLTLQKKRAEKNRDRS